MCVESKNIIQKYLIDSDLTDDGSSDQWVIVTKKATFLDLGTGDGTLLSYIHNEFGIGYERMMGISANDNRRADSAIPNSSYKTLNIDLLNEVGF